MGRQAYMTRLALGRSPYEAPVLSESREFILGTYAHELDNPDVYTQQYNERGHPEFRSCRVAARELRRAKNDVLSTVGLVYKASDHPRRAKNNDQMVELVMSENMFGFFLFSTGKVSTFVLMWWLHALRMRVLVYQGYSLPLLQIIRSELRTIGAVRFFSLGLPECHLRAVLDRRRTPLWYDSWERFVVKLGLEQICGVLMVSLRLSASGLSMLKALDLGGEKMGLWFMVPFALKSIFRRPKSVIEALTMPIFLLWLHSKAYSLFYTTIWHALQRLVPRSDRPDRMSSLAIHRAVGFDVTKFRNGPWSLRDEVAFQFSGFRLWIAKLRDSLPGHCFQYRSSRKESNQQELGSMSVRRHDMGLNADRNSSATPNPEELFHMEDVVPPEPEANSLSRTNTLFSPLNRSPATTPPVSPHMRASLIHRDSETVTMQLELLENQRRLAMPDRHRSLHEPQGDHARHQDDVQDAPPDTNAEASVEAHHPTPQPAGVMETRASDLTRATQERDEEANDSDDENERGANMYAEFDGVDDSSTSSPHINETRAPRTDHHQHRHHHHRRRHRRHHGRDQRVTGLSNFPADSCSLHATYLITTAALLPLESLLVRSLAKNFISSLPSPTSSTSSTSLSSPSSLSSSSLQTLRGNLRPLFPPLFSTGWRYHANILALLGAQALLSSVLWGVGTAVAVAFGRASYGWVRGGRKRARAQAESTTRTRTRTRTRNERRRRSSLNGGR